MKKIYSVETIGFDSHGVAGKTRVMVSGQANTGGWGEAHLIKTDPQPSDGNVHLDLVAEPPAPGTIFTESFQTKKTSLEISADKLKAVTVHASKNELTKEYGPA